MEAKDAGSRHENSNTIWYLHVVAPLIILVLIIVIAIYLYYALRMPTPPRSLGVNSPRGIGEDDWDNLRIGLYRNRSSSQTEICSICLAHLEGLVCALPICSHTYHTPCIHKWLSKNSLCPLCRKPAFGAVTRKHEDHSGARTEEVEVEEEEEEEGEAEQNQIGAADDFVSLEILEVIGTERPEGELIGMPILSRMMSLKQRSVNIPGRSCEMTSSSFSEN